jgi:hypothetical protein
MPKTDPDDETLLVSLDVLDGSECLFAYRDTPHGTDSGWVLLSGEEPDEQLANRKMFAEKRVGWAREAIEGFDAIAAAPPETAVERESEDSPWVELEE